MKGFLKPAIYIAIGIIVAFPLFSLTYYTMVRTSTPEFCASCHEIRPAYEEWKTSTHVNNGQGFVADCMDCHLPAPHDTLNFFYAKTFHGLKDILIHLSGQPYDRQAMKKQARAGIKNDQCMKCHRNLLYIPNKRGAMLAHRAVVYALPGQEKRCLDCHANLVHKPRAYYDYKQYNSGL